MLRASKEYEGPIISSIALLSSGLDSVASLAVAYKKTTVKLALIFDYGQKAASKEIEYSRVIAERYGINHKVILLPWLKEITTTSLVNRNMAVPELSMQDIEKESDPTITIDSAKKVWVPNRNGVMINIAASFAESLDCEYIIVGFNSEEAVTFPDNSYAYLEVIDNCLSYSTRNGVKMLAPVAGLNKKDIISKALEMKAPLEWSWSCYHGGEVPCGVCESCIRRKRAFMQVGIKDPLMVRLGID
jgi:7-cyano-7-deazaguanine synthase